MTNGVGVFQVPIPIVLGADQPAGEFFIPMVTVEGYGGATGSVFETPIPVVEGTGSAPLAAGLFYLPIIEISGSASYATQRGDGIFILPTPVISSEDLFRGTGVFSLPTPVVWGNELARFVIPIPDVSGFGRSAQASKIYKAVVMNIANQAISTYNAFPFNSITYFDGHYYGASDTGIYLLEGNKDATAYIQSKLKTGPLDFGDNFIKHLRDIWLTYRSDGHLAIVLATKEDESDRTSDLVTAIAGDQIHEEKVKTPRGLNGRFYIVELKNLSGSDFDLRALTMMVEAIRRKIR